ncbi:MAG: LD-carboxypeptidase [Bacteroidales bacterium]|nr:LD-carboxypeptidase [Bacteroidales bacterium]
MRPQFLKEGDTVAVIAIASAPSQGQLAANWKAQLESWGLKVKLGKNLTATFPGDFAGTHLQRAQDLQEMIQDPEVKAIISIRGGYGTMHTIKNLNLELFKENPKWLVGYSDITILHYALQKMGLESIHGAMCGTFTEEFDGFSQNSLRDALFGNVAAYTTNPHQYNVKGSAQGRLIGGNLTLMRNLVATPNDHNFDEPTILFIEDIDERMYTIDSKLWHLRECGHLAKCKGIVVGYFTDTREEDQWQRNVLDLINEYTAPLGIPVMFNFPCGHEHPNASIYLGRQVEMSVGESGGVLRFL